MRYHPAPMVLNEVWGGHHSLSDAGVSKRQFMPQNFQRRRNTNFPFVPIADEAEQKTFSVSSNQLVCFHGYSSIFTLQHRVFSFYMHKKVMRTFTQASFTVDGVEYKSVDQYYQKCKVKDLLGLESEQFIDGSTKNFSSLARDLLRQSGVERKVVDKWRITSGVQVIQKALLEKVRQCQELKDELIKTGEKLIVHTYVADDFFGAGVPVNFMKAWAGNMDKKKVSVKLPMSFPLSDESLKNVPTVGKGRNVLGTIYMVLREKINMGQLASLNVQLTSAVKAEDITEVFKQGASLSAQKKPSSASQSSAPQKMEIDFTADDDADVMSSPPAITSTTAAPNSATVQMQALNAGGAATKPKSTAKTKIAINRAPVARIINSNNVVKKTQNTSAMVVKKVGNTNVLKKI